MSEIRKLLDAHEAAIAGRIHALREELVPLERELFEIGLARAALDRSPKSGDQPELFTRASGRSAEIGQKIKLRNMMVHASWSTPQSPYGRFTIKELIVKALEEHFEQGATAIQLLDLFASAWGRDDIARTSLSPQLSRLRQDGKLTREGQIWRLHRPHVPENEAAIDQ